MNPNPVLPLAALALTSACVSSTQAPPSAVRPVFSSYRMGATRPVTLTAPYGGYLTQQGPCLGLTVDGRFATIIWPETARLEFDRHGFLLRDTSGDARLRVGDYLVGTGGPLPAGVVHDLGETSLTEGFPIECARRPGRDGWIGIVNLGFTKGRAPRP